MMPTKIMKLLCFLIPFIYSCNKSSDNRNYSYIDYDTDSTFYKINVCDSDDYLQSQEEDWKETILVTNSVFIKDSCFGGLSTLPSAIKYAKSIHVQEPSDCFTRTVINIMNLNGEFRKTWRVDRNFYWPDGEFGDYAGKIEVDEGYYKIDGKNYNGIRIIEKINGDNLSLKFLNYIYENNSWQLISREHINTMSSENDYVYCKDSLNRNIQKQDKLPIIVNNQTFYDFTAPNCR